MSASWKWFACAVSGYGLVLGSATVLAGLVQGPGSLPQAPVVVAAYVQLVVLAVAVPFWVSTEGGRSGSAELLQLAGKMLVLLAAGLVAVAAAACILGSPDLLRTLLVQAVVASFAVAAAGVSTLVLVVLRRRSASQLLTSVVLLALLSAPLLANPLVRHVGPAHRTLTIDCVSYTSGIVVATYTAGVDFYRGPRMYLWSVVGDYAFRAPSTLVACGLYLGVGLVLTGVCRPLRPRFS